MCFTQEVSASFAAFMWLWAFFWKGPTGARLCVAYFALMETIQAAQYSVIADNALGDECNMWQNKWLTVAGIGHLAFQPFFSNLFLMQFMTKSQKAHMKLVLLLCLFGGVSMVLRMIVSPVDVPCSFGVEPLCGKRTCSFQGDTHVAWQMPLQHCDQDYFTPGFQMHFFLFYLPTFAMGMWRHTIFLLLTGPILGRLLTEHHDEIPAIWCYFSIVQVMAPLAYGYFLDKGNKSKAKAAKKNDVARANSGSTGFQGLQDVTGGYWGMFTKVLGFTLCMVAKRLVTDYIMVGADGYNDLAAAAAATQATAAA